MVLILIPLLPHTADAEQSAAANNTTWTTLFDGTSMGAWRAYGQSTVPSQWTIEDKALVLTGRGGGDLITVETFRGFELELEWQIGAGGNSGIFFLADESAQPIYVHAPEIQILDNERHADREQPDRRSGSLYDLIAAPASSQRASGEWNHVRIRHHQGLLQVWQNSEATVDIVIGSARWKELVSASKFATWAGFGTLQEGHIGLQDHGDRVAFRNIRIRRLP
jgi:hypothetical protein